MVEEMRIALRNVGKINPGSIDEYINAGGYIALAKAKKMGSDDILNELEQSGKLRGRGGAGFNTGLKWRSAANVQSEKKYVICNADEGEPGTYKDRIVLENDPHSIIEGMLICAYAIGADEAIIYCRGEYKQAIAIISNAIVQVEESGLLDGVTLRIVSGAGSYVCGEETALIESLEGKRGEPRLKPPYPTIAGYMGKPTVVNNVETFATIPVIIDKGAKWFSSLGKPNFPGTKILCLCGDVNNKVYIEVTTDTTIKDVIYGFGGGIPNGRKLKAVQMGGSSCGFLTEDMLDTSIDFESMRDSGASLGSGSVFVIDDSHNLVDVLISITSFFEDESCGKCVSCREGTGRMARLVEKIADGGATKKDLELIQQLAAYMQVSSFCPLGQSAPVAVISAIHLFKEDFSKRMQTQEV